MVYPVVLFDLDHTLVDSEQSEAQAIASTFEAVGLDPSGEVVAMYKAINQTLWAEVERGVRTVTQVKTLRFRRLLLAVGHDADPEAMADHFADGLGAHGDLLPGARDTLEAVGQLARLGLVTNGLSTVQRARLERLELDHHFDAVVISAEVGVAKPDAAIFDLVLDQLDVADGTDILMVGDSLTSDIQGAAAAGIASCWYNPNGAVRTDADVVPTHEIAHLEQLTAVVEGRH